MMVIAFEERSRFVTDPVKVRSPVSIEVMAFELKVRLTTCVNWGRPLGMRVSLFESRFNVSTGVVGAIFVTMISIAESVSA